MRRLKQWEKLISVFLHTCGDVIDGEFLDEK